MIVALLVHLVSPAVAGPPAGVPTDEADVWEERWGRLQAGPPGCWEIVGRASWNWTAGRHGASRGTSAFVGKLEDGMWKDFFIRSLGEVVDEPGHVSMYQYPHGEQRFIPLIGKLSPRVRVSNQGVAEDLLRDIVDEMGGAVTTSWSDWSDGRGGVVLHRAVPLEVGNRTATATMEVVFPGGGDVPDRMDMTVDQPLPIAGWPTARMTAADAHVQGMLVGADVFPSSESFAWSGAAFGYRASGSQTIRYDHVRPCGLPTEAAPTSILP